MTDCNAETALVRVGSDGNDGKLPLIRRDQKGDFERCDAAHRAKERDTHLTHVCIKQFCGISSALSARSILPPLENHGFLPLSERAQSARGGA